MLGKAVSSVATNTADSVYRSCVESYPCKSFLYATKYLKECGCFLQNRFKYNNLMKDILTPLKET